MWSLFMCAFSFLVLLQLRINFKMACLRPLSSSPKLTSKSGCWLETNRVSSLTYLPQIELLMAAKPSVLVWCLYSWCFHYCSCTPLQCPTETAENIGYSCNMLREEMKDIFIVATNTAEEVREELVWVSSVSPSPKPFQMDHIWN